MGKIKSLNDSTPVSILLDVKVGDKVSYSNKIGIVESISFDENSNYWEIIFHLEEGSALYLRKDKTAC